MKINNDYPYSEITSFDDFKFEKERLKMKKKLIETKINSSVNQVAQIFSVSNIIFSLAREYILPKISTLLGVLIKKS